MPKTGPHSDGKILDTDQIRKSYRRLIRKAMVLASVIALIYSLWYY